MEWKFPVEMMIYCNECGKHFDISIADRKPANYPCPACGKVHLFDLEAFVTRAIQQSMKMLGKSGHRRFNP